MSFSFYYDYENENKFSENKEKREFCFYQKAPLVVHYWSNHFV